MHFAELDENSIVKRVIVAEQGFIDSGAVGDPKNWIETTPKGKIRKNYAGIGYKYDKDRDAFIPPKMYDSWIFDEDKCQYKPPKDKPDELEPYEWDEGKADWVKIK